MVPVLLVDDDATVLSGLQALLDYEQIGSATAIDAASAHARIEAQFYPVILADLRLRSDQDGLELIERIRKISPNSRIAAMTGSLTPDLEALAINAGATTLLRKPFDGDVLIATIRSLLAEQPATSWDDEAIYEKTTPRLRAMIARRYRLSRDESEDVIQQAWCALLEHRHEVRDLGAWLAGTVMNLCRQTIHRKVRETALDGASAEGSYSSSHATTMAVQSALARLDDRSRQLCTLIGLEQLSYAEASERLALPLGSIGPLYQRARRRLKQELMN